jgi:1,2-phenylacetyl-CoA epoxidase catalytic subunit
MAADAATKPEIQAALDFWFPKVNKIFGKPNTDSNKTFRKLKIKQRDNQEVRESWFNEIKLLLDSYGMTCPSIDLIEK